MEQTQIMGWHRQLIWQELCFMAWLNKAEQTQKVYETHKDAQAITHLNKWLF